MSPNSPFRATSSRRCSLRARTSDASQPHRSVDFWVADVEAAAAKVTEQGGELVAPPYDIPGAGMKQAVVADPQGAVLSLTQPPCAG